MSAYKKLALAATAVALFAGQAMAQDKVVNVYNWSDYIDPSVLESFTKDTGIKVVYDTMDSNEVLETKLYAGNTGYDVVVPSNLNLKREIAHDVLQPLDKSKIPNLKYAWDKVTTPLQSYDPDNKYAVNYMWGTTGIGYNVDKAKKIMGDNPMNTWDVVFNPDTMSKFAECGVYFLDSPDDIMPSAMRYLGLPPDSKDPKDIAKAAKLLQSVSKYVKKFHSSEYINALANGDICLVVGYSGDIIQAKSRAADAHTKSPDKPLVDISYVIPKEGALMWFDSMAIPKDAPHVAEAHAFIDYMERPEIAAKNSSFLGYANGNLESQKSVSPDVLNDKSIYPDDATIATLFTTTPSDAKTQKLWTRTWTKIKTGQ
jgi:putrescine transport system substrate-binding protein